MVKSILTEWERGERECFKALEDGKMALELGCGNGHFITELANKYSDTTYFAVDRRRNSLVRAWQKLDKLKLTNVQLINGDIFTVLDSYFEPGSFDEIFINFPDPWVKRRHFKKRVMGEDRLKCYYHYLKEGGHLYFVTDNEEYRESALETVLESGLFQPELPSPYYTCCLEWYPVSLYELKWRKMGRWIYYSIFLKKVLDYKD